MKLAAVLYDVGEGRAVDSLLASLALRLKRAGFRLAGAVQSNVAVAGTGRSDIVLEVSGDSSYTLKWGNNRPSTGTVTARGNRLILDDESGSRITLVHSRDTLYGVMKDQEDGRSTMMSLAKQESAPSRFAGTSPRC